MVAHAAVEELKLDRLFFIPAARSPFKPNDELADPKARCALIRLATANVPFFEVDPRETQRGGTSYTIETVRHYRHSFPQVQLHYLIGADHVAKLQEWREAHELARLCEFVVAPRPGETPLALPAPFRGTVLKGFPMAIASSVIRARIKSGLRIDHLVPPRVAEAIRNNRLYL